MIQYVTLDGKPLELGSRPSHKAVKKTRPKSDEKIHKGFLVVGFSPEHIKEAEASHAKRKEAGEKGYEHDFSLEVYLNKAKPHKARSKPYEVPEAAETCADMMRKIGWIRVQVQELIK